MHATLLGFAIGLPVLLAGVAFGWLLARAMREAPRPARVLLFVTVFLLLCAPLAHRFGTWILLK